MAVLTANIGAVIETDIVATLDTDTGILSLAGSGATKEIEQPSRDTGGIFDDGGEYSSIVKKIIIQEGITELNGACFYYMNNVTMVEIPSTLQVIGERCFFYCSSVSEFTLPATLRTIGDDAFYGCTDSVATVLSKDVTIYNTLSTSPNTLNLKKIRGYIGSTAETYAKTYDVPFEMIDKLSGIRITSLPAKTKYKVNETFEIDGLVVTALYDNGETETITDYTLSAPDMSSTGSKTVTVTYNGQTATFDITVIDATGIEVTALPDKIRYYENDAFSSDGLIVSLVHTDGSWETVSEYTLSTPDMSTGGSKIVTITYNSFRATFEIKVVGVSGIEITKLPTKVEYKIGEEFDISGLVVSVVYTDGTKKAITENDFFRTGFDSVTAGEKEVQISYTSGGKSYTATFPVMVYAETVGIRIDSYPSKFYYKIGESLDTSGMQVKIVMADGKERLIQEYTCSGFDSTTAGAKKITVIYTENGKKFHTSFQVRVTNDGENPFENDAAEFTVTVHWPDGEFADLTHEDISTSSIVLQESLCDASYFIFGGCLHNMISFSTHSSQFWGTEEKDTPHGKIEVSICCAGTTEKIFTGIIDSGKRDTDTVTRKIVAYDELYKYRNADIAKWYKSKTTNNTPPQIWTQKQFRDNLFAYLGIEQVETVLEYDAACVPNNSAINEMNVVSILKDLCLQNSVFGWMNREGKFEYVKLPENSYLSGTDKKGNKSYGYYEAELRFDLYEKLTFTEGCIWYPYNFYTTPDPRYWFGDGEPSTAQEAYEMNTYYNRNSFFVGDSDWLDYVWDTDEYGSTSLEEPIMPICYGTTNKVDNQHLYRAQQYSITLPGNPFNRVGQTIEILDRRPMPDGRELTWTIHSYIMSRTLRILGDNCLEDTYSANNAPYNGNNQELGKSVPQISAETYRTRSEMPVISYDFSDGTSGISTQAEKTSGSKAMLRCMKQIRKTDFDALPEETRKRNDTIFLTYEED